MKKSNEKIDALNSSIEEIKTLLAGKKDGGEGGGGGKGEGSGHKKVDPEIAELRRELEQTQNHLKSETERRAAAEKEREEDRFESVVKDALNKAGCLATDSAFLAIKPHIKKKEDGTPFATVTLDESGLETDVDLETFIKRYFAEDILPYVFKGKMRTGSPASGEGDGGGTGQGYDYTWEQLQNDPEFYAENAEKVRKALESGRVKGVPKQGSGAV